MNILVTGANGFLGREIIKELQKDKDNSITGIGRKNIECNYNYYTADVLDSKSVEKIFSTNAFDVVIHLAALTEHCQIVDNKYETLNINLTGTENLLKAFNKYCRNSLFVYASTGKVYGKTNEMPISENAFTRPTNVLGKSKLITEKIIDFYAQPENTYLITRIFNIYGGNQKENFIVPTIIKQLQQGNILKLGNVEDKRDYLYIKDFVQAFVKCIYNKDNFNSFDIVNIGSGIPVSVSDIVDAFKYCLNRDIKIVLDKSKLRFDETPVEYADNKKLCQLTDWEQEYDLNKAINEICQTSGLSLETR